MDIDHKGKKRIPNEIAKDFLDREHRKHICEKYKDGTFWGKSVSGEEVELYISETGIILKIYQKNGWLKVSEFDAEGYITNERFEDRWK